MYRIVVLGGTDTFIHELQNHFRKERKIIFFPFRTMPNDQAIKSAQAVFLQSRAVEHKVTKKVYALKRHDRGCIHYFTSSSAARAILELEAFLAAS